METLLLCVLAFGVGMSVEWFRERKHRKLLKEYRRRYELR